MFWKQVWQYSTPPIRPRRLPWPTCTLCPDNSSRKLRHRLSKSPCIPLPASLRMPIYFLLAGLSFSTFFNVPAFRCLGPTPTVSRPLTFLLPSLTEVPLLHELHTAPPIPVEPLSDAPADLASIAPACSHEPLLILHTPTYHATARRAICRSLPLRPESP